MRMIVIMSWCPVGVMIVPGRIGWRHGGDAREIKFKRVISAISRYLGLRIADSYLSW